MFWTEPVTLLGMIPFRSYRQHHSQEEESIQTGGYLVLAQPSAWTNGTTFTSGMGSTSKTIGIPISFKGGRIHVLNVPLVLSQSLAHEAQSVAGDALEHAVTSGPILANVTKSNLLSKVAVFLTINRAWQRIGSLVDEWTRAEVDRILSYHIVEGVMYQDFTNPSDVNLRS
jgi:hypothetical protein